MPVVVLILCFIVALCYTAWKGTLVARANGEEIQRSFRAFMRYAYYGAQVIDRERQQRKLYRRARGLKARELRAREAQLAAMYQATYPPFGGTRTRQPIPRDVKRQVWLRCGGCCLHCGISDADAMLRDGEHLQYDHIVPWSWNGADTAGNLQLLCGPCNRAKGARYTG